ncbi:MAG TPA: hypothetical protein DGD08_13305 [Gemmatimonas aurantiaca]|uniref:Uncharacterized protein n=1 Tax=Gemmatimonas aurantiaca TaxID=173480 RepID=A0A3D4VAP7_9BACT|nr:hypothetical protein [Gemmatimonas aurantiaca]
MVVPATWLMQEGGEVIAVRLMRDVLAMPAPSAGRWSLVPYGSRRGWQLLGRQDADGQWPAGWLTVPDGDGVDQAGSIVAFRALLELGWDRESPGMAAARRWLFRLLAADDDPTLMAELRPALDDEELVVRGRHQLREAAAAALAQAGFESDPRLRGAARRLLQRVDDFLRSPLAAKPWVRVGNQHLLAADAEPPSFHFLQMLAFMPQFRSEHFESMERLYAYVSQPWPRQAAVQQIGSRQLEQPQLVLGDLMATRGDLDAAMPSALTWLETMARMGFLQRHEGWGRLLDRLLADRDRRDVWVPRRSVVMPTNVPDWAWPSMILTDRERPAGASIDVTFRLALIARLAGRTLEIR